MNFIYKTNPIHTHENVALDHEIEVYFMIDLNAKLLREEHVVLLNLTNQKIESVSFTYERRVMRIKPDERFTPLCHYQLMITGGGEGIKDIVGRQMDDTYEVEFYTKDVESIKPPTILSPTDLSVTRSKPSFNLSPSTGAFYYELEISRSNTFQNIIWPTNGQKVHQSNEIKVTPDVTYEKGQYYTRARSVNGEGIKSAWSSVVRFYFNNEEVIQPLEEEPFPNEAPTVTMPMETESTTSVRNIVLKAASQSQATHSELNQLQDIFSMQLGNEVADLKVKQVQPGDGSVNNNLSSLKQIIIEFTEDIDPTTIDSSTCYVLAERN